ncbi:hypothetical protein [Bacillus pinisoli]|uniref:hypothetical protein n=1 Tax=Bacillus pinisoli TaxID=2901866 RepID=UPI001FF63F15|nr:hypothetical protein [Bacillus pinisoli]
MKHLFILVCILGIVAYLDSPISMSGHRIDYETLVPAMAEVAGEEEEITSIPTFEMQLIKKEVIDGHVVETYQEFEVLKDKNGEIISSTPTEKLEYLRYFISKP